MYSKLKRKYYLKSMSVILKCTTTSWEFDSFALDFYSKMLKINVHYECMHSKQRVHGINSVNLLSCRCAMHL